VETNSWHNPVITYPNHSVYGGSPVRLPGSITACCVPATWRVMTQPVQSLYLFLALAADAPRPVVEEFSTIKSGDVILPTKNPMAGCRQLGGTLRDATGGTLGGARTAAGTEAARPVDAVPSWRLGKRSQRRKCSANFLKKPALATAPGPFSSRDSVT